MAIQKEAKRVKFGQSLTDLENQAINAISQLQGVKTNLLSMKTTIGADADFTAEDTAEVNNVINGLVTKIQAILN